MSGDRDRTACGIMADLLQQGRILHHVSTALGVVALAMAFFAMGRASFRLSLVASLGFCLAQICLAVRTSFDAALFRRLEQGLTLDGFDDAMAALSLVPPRKAGRTLAQRAAGARRLLRLQGWALLLQVASLAPPVLWLKP